MPPKKASNTKTETKTETKSKTKKPEVEVESVTSENSDDFTEESDSEDSDSESESESSESDSETVTEKTTESKPKAVKEKPKKLTADEAAVELQNGFGEVAILDNEINELFKSYVAKIKQRDTLIKKLNKITKDLPTSITKACDAARKEKKKRTNTSKSGIMEEKPVPPVLIKFLGLKEGTTMQRTKVFSLLNNKFKELELKKGQDTILDKKTAKLFGYDEGHVIGFKDAQKFLSNIYNAHEAKSNEVNL
jgi:hypothetical protein